MNMPSVSNLVQLERGPGKKPLRINYLAYRRLDDAELRRMVAFLMGTKQGRAAFRKGGSLEIVTSIGGRDPIGGACGEWR